MPKVASTSRERNYYIEDIERYIFPTSPTSCGTDYRTNHISKGGWISHAHTARFAKTEDPARWDEGYFKDHSHYIG